MAPPLPDFLGPREENASSPSSIESFPRINEYIQAPPVITSPTNELDSIKPSGTEK